MAVSQRATKTDAFRLHTRRGGMGLVYRVYRGQRHVQGIVLPKRLDKIMPPRLWKRLEKGASDL